MTVRTVTLVQRVIALTVSYARAGLLPLWSLFYEKVFDADGNTIHLPVTEMIAVSSCLVAACLLGVLVARRFTRFYYKVWQLYLPTASLLTLAVIFAVNVYMHQPLLRQISLKTSLFVVLVVLAGFGSGMGVAYMSRLTHAQQMTVCLETGSRTPYIVSALLHASLAEPEAQLACSAPALYCLLCISASAVGACVCRVVSRRRSTRRLVDAQCDLLATSSDDIYDADHLQLQTRSNRTRGLVNKFPA